LDKKYIPDKPQPDKAGQASPAFLQNRRRIEMDITGIAKNYHAGIQKAGKASSQKEWKLSDSLRENIAGYAREDAAQGIYMGNKFLALRKSEVAKVAPDRAGIPGVPADWGIGEQEGK
jgi:hypothetical protein